MRNSNGPDTIMIGISPPFLPDESPAELLSSTHEYNTNITYPLFLTSEADTFTFPPEGLQIPYVSRETDPIIDKDVGWNDSPDSPYPIPSKSPDEPTHDIPIVNPIDGVQKTFFRQLIDEYKDIFVNDIPVEGSSLPPYELHIRPDFKFSKQRPPRRFAQAIQEFILEKVTELLRLGIIIAILASHAADIVVVNQKGRNRMCINYVEMNSGLIPFTYPIPSLKDHLLFLKSKLVYSVLDNKMGYHQLRVSPAFQYLLAFQTQHGQYTWTRCPFGPSTLPAWYNFLMTTIVFAGLLYTLAVCYFDDAVVASDSYPQHLADLKVVFDRYRQYKLVLRGTKCQIAVKEITYHGHIITSNTISHDPKRITTVFNIPQPIRPKQLQSFLGMANYFGEFIRDYKNIRAPLNPMSVMKKLQWTPETEKAFVDLKTAVRNITKLYFIDYNLPIFLDIDASKKGIGGYLFNVINCHPDTDPNDPKNQLPIAFISHAFSASQQKWSVQEQEAYALSFCVLSVAHLISGVHFKLRTDHMNFIKMFSSESFLVQRAFLKIQGFQFTLIPIAGCLNYCPDTWSRLHYISIVSEFPIILTPPVVEPITSIMPIHVQPPNFIPDNVELDIFDRPVNPIPPPPVNDEPYFLPPLDNPPRVTFNIPNIKIPDISAEHLRILRHAHYYGGHLGIDPSLQYLRDNNYYWPFMRRDLIAFISTCPACQMTWRRARVARLLRHTFDSYDPFYKIIIDFQGPFAPADCDGNLYFFNVIDAFTRYLRIFPCKDNTTDSAARCLLDIYSHYTLPRIIVCSDNAQQFISETYKKLLIFISGEPSYSLPYIHQSSIERPQREVLRHTRVLRIMRPDSSDHTRYITALLTQKIINYATHKDIDCSPHELLFGVHHNFEQIPIQHTPIAEPRPVYNIVNEMITVQIDLLARSRAHQAKNTDFYLLPNINQIQQVFSPGQWVTVTYPDGSPFKDDPTCQGPFRVIARHNDSYTLFDTVKNTNSKNPVHISRLQLYNNSDYHELTPEAIARINADVFVISAILGHTPDITSRRTLQFYVSYAGYDDSYNGYISCNDAANLTMMDEYINRYPELRRIMSHHHK